LVRLVVVQEEEAEEIYWSSREESTTRFSNSLYDSYDPFSYMADRVSSSYIIFGPPPLTKCRGTDFSD
jgi:hypothetical protein